MKTTAPLFEIEDRVVARPLRRVAPVAVEASEDNVTGVAGIALVGELLDRLGLVEVADRHHLRPIGPGGYSGGECYRPIVELQLAVEMSHGLACDVGIVLLASSRSCSG